MQHNINPIQQMNLIKKFVSPRALRFFCCFFLCFLQNLALWAAEVSPEKARETAIRFLNQQSGTDYSRTGGQDLSLVYVKKLTEASNNRVQSQAVYYIFQSGEKGFVMVSGDDATYPILAYSEESSFDQSRLPEAFVKWSARYEKQIRDIIREQKPASARVSRAWEQMSVEAESAVAPLMRTKWDQSPYFNDLCPYDPAHEQRAVVGCVATAMAQIMKYHQYPQRGSGFHTYNHRTYGTISADFGLAEYQWEQMPDLLNEPNQAVALLSFHAGVSVDMNYGVNSSGAAGAVLVQPALQQYFQYEAEIAHRENFTQQQWIGLLMAELDAGRPVYYEGLGNGTGHAFVCDGYQNADFFHFNWGWGGMMDGYYYINDLSPSELGTGGGNGSYNNDQAIVYGIKPANAGNQEPNEPDNFDLQLYSEIQLEPNPILFANPFTVNVSVANFGPAPFAGKLAAVITNRENITELLDSIAIPAFEAQTYYDLTFSSDGLALATPGAYAVAIFYKEDGGDWLLIKSDTYSYIAETEILGSDNGMALNAPIELSHANIIQGEAFSLEFNVVNQGETTFNGKLYATLYDLEGNFQEVIDSLEVDELSPGYTYQENISMQTSGIWLEPGTYLLAMISSDDLETLLLGEGDYANPVSVIVQSPAIQADAYEDNDSEPNAFPLVIPDFVQDMAVIKTNDANQHNDLDYDYYVLDLPVGADYSMYARVHDSYDSEDGNAYTNDVVFSYKIADGEWSEAYDISMDEAIDITGGSRLVVWVAPYFAGQIGNYALDIQLARSQHQQETLVLNNSLGGSSLKPGSQQLISWQSNISGTLDLDLYRAGQLVTKIAENIANTGAYTWLVSDALSASEDYKLVIYSSSNHQLRAESGAFSIESVTSIADDLLQQLTIFPNPAQQELHLLFDYAKADAAYLYNAQGMLHSQFTIEQLDEVIDLSAYAQGLYLLVLEWPEGRRSSHKILKR
jgi:hypothetical protein